MTDVATGYGPCPECGEDITAEDEVHTWPGDGVSDCHQECCGECHRVGLSVTQLCPDCLSHYSPSARHTCYDW